MCWNDFLWFTCKCNILHRERKLKMSLLTRLTSNFSTSLWNVNGTSNLNVHLYIKIKHKRKILNMQSDDHDKGSATTKRRLLFLDQFKIQERTRSI